MVKRMGHIMDDAVDIGRSLVFYFMRSEPSLINRANRVLQRSGGFTPQQAIMFGSRQMLQHENDFAAATKLTTDTYKKVARNRQLCEHRNEAGKPTTRRYGCPAGKFTTCNLCERRWRWHDKNSAWEVYDKDAVEAGLLPRATSATTAAGSSKPSSRPPQQSAASSAPPVERVRVRSTAPTARRFRSTTAAPPAKNRSEAPTTEHTISSDTESSPSVYNLD